MGQWGLSALLLSASVVSCSGRGFVLLAERESPIGSGGTTGITDPKDARAGAGGTDPQASGGGGSDAAATGGVPPASGGSNASGGSGEEPPPEPTEDVEPPPEVTVCGTPRTADADLRLSEVCIPAGSFEMGSAEAVPNSSFNVHGPMHEVTLSNFWLGAYEVTVGRYRSCVNAAACTAPRLSDVDGCTYSVLAAASESKPVTCITWDQATAFCGWDDQRRLPTEAEWEFAARGTLGRRYAFGDTFDCSLAVVGSSSGCPQHASVLPANVGSIAAGQTPEAAFDLTGNTSEWVSDWIGSYSAGPETDPQGPATGGAKVYRGGGWRDAPGFVLTHLRRSATRTTAGTTGFRCARSAAP